MYLEGTLEKVPPSPSLENGTLLHLYVENPESFVVSEVTKPNESLCNVVAQYFAIKDSHLELSVEDLMLKAGTSDNGAGYKGGRLYLNGGMGYQSAFNANGGDIIMQILN